MPAIDHKFKEFFPIDLDKGANSESEHNAFLELANTLYRKFEQAQTYQQSIEVANQLLQYIKHHFSLKSPYSPNLLQKQMDIVWDFLLQELQMRFSMEYDREKKKAEAAKACDEEIRRDDAKLKELLESYKNADALERQKQAPQPSGFFIRGQQADFKTSSKVIEIPPHVERAVEELLAGNLLDTDRYLENFVRMDEDGNIPIGPLPEEASNWLDAYKAEVEARIKEYKDCSCLDTRKEKIKRQMSEELHEIKEQSGFSFTKENSFHCK